MLYQAQPGLLVYIDLYYATGGQPDEIVWMVEEQARQVRGPPVRGNVYIRPAGPLGAFPGFLECNLEALKQGAFAANWKQ